MASKTIGGLIFWGAVAVALALYGLTVPEGLPWNDSTRLACAYLGDGGLVGSVLPAEAALPHPIWGFYVKVFGGAVELSVFLTAIAAGLIAVLANRYLGWRFAAGAALLWIFLPSVWNRAITGERGVCLAAMAVVGIWTLHAVALWVTRKAWVVRWSAPAGRVNCIAGWVALGMAGLFALVSASMHDYRLGEAASAYARLVVEAAGDRVILLNGVCDEQVVNALNKNSNFISFRNTEANRSNLVAWVKREWPSETNLWLEAEIGPATFAETAVKAHPERFYSMMGHSTTLAQWEERWEKMKPYLASGDPFVPAMRRLFAYEANLLGNRILESGSPTPVNNTNSAARRAWNLYYRIFTEIHPQNPAACANLNLMLRQGYKVDDSTRQRVESGQSDYARIMADRRKARQVAEWISHFGPVMRDQQAYAELRERVRKRMAELEKSGDMAAMIPDLKTLAEWHSEMMRAFAAGEHEQATRIARTILARKAWRGFVPAYMVVGEEMVRKGDWVAAEAFLRVAAEATGPAAPPPFVLNDYAESLRQLGRLTAAEEYARRAVREEEKKQRWIYRLTLAEVLEAKERNPATEVEISDLLKSVLKDAPNAMREKILKEHRDWLR